MQDRPDVSILLEAIQDFIIKDLLPEIKDKEALSYKALVSWNMLGVIHREWKQGEKLLDLEIHRILEFFRKNSILFANLEGENKTYQEKTEIARELNFKLSEHIRKKQISLDDAEVWDLVKKSIQDKLTIANPRF
jgi:hypothetical protein